MTPTPGALRAVLAIYAKYTPSGHPRDVRDDMARIIDAETGAAALVKALRFYADEDTYRHRGIYMGGGGDSSRIQGDRGRRARAALKAAGEGA